MPNFTKKAENSAKSNKMDEFFYSRIDDLFARVDRGVISFSPFYNESEIHAAREYLHSIGRKDIFFFGGYDDAERKRLFVFPDWFEPDKDNMREYIEPVLIRGSGYAKLDHRSYLGALTAAGFSRDVIGDIVVQDETSAVIFFDTRIADYLTSDMSPLERIGRDKVKITRYTLPHGFSSSKEVIGISGTVASARLDCVVGELVNTSREKTKELISAGQVMHNYAQAQNFSAEVTEGDIISVRGYGKFRIEKLKERTKKGRIRLLAVKYV